MPADDRTSKDINKRYVIIINYCDSWCDRTSDNNKNNKNNNPLAPQSTEGQSPPTNRDERSSIQFTGDVWSARRVPQPLLALEKGTPATNSSCPNSSTCWVSTDLPWRGRNWDRCMRGSESASAPQRWTISTLLFILLPFIPLNRGNRGFLWTTYTRKLSRIKLEDIWSLISRLVEPSRTIQKRTWTNDTTTQKH